MVCLMWRLHTKASQLHSKIIASMKWYFFGFIVSKLSLIVMYTAAEVHYHDFVVQATPVERLCKTRTIITVNGQFSGPTLGDTLIIKMHAFSANWTGDRGCRSSRILQEALLGFIIRRRSGLRFSVEMEMHWVTKLGKETLRYFARRVTLGF